MSDFRPYFYAPLAAYPNVFKCAGIATAANIAHVTAKHPEVVVLQGYRGDKLSRACAFRMAREG
jgi:hypothetical protein